MRTTLSVLGRKARSFRRRPLPEKLWFGPAYLLLGLSRLALLMLPFRWIARRLGHSLKTAAVVPLAARAETDRALRIGRAIEVAARYTPWDSACLAQAITARILLGLNGLPYALYLGVDKRGDAGIAAHAWVCTGRAAVTGGHSFGEFTVIGTYSSLKPRPTTGC